MSLSSAPRVFSDVAQSPGTASGPAETGEAASGRVRVQLEPLGSDGVVEGEIRELSTNEVVVATTATIVTGGRAFVGIEDAGSPPVVALVEIVERRVSVDDDGVELRARFIRLTEANSARLARLRACTPMSPSSPSAPERPR